MVKIKNPEAIIINTGTELLLGNIANTNGAYIAKELSELGVNCHKIVAIGDNSQRMETLLKTEFPYHNIFIFTGGMGSTVDDITKEVVAKVLNIPLKHSKIIEEQLLRKYGKRKISIQSLKETYIFSKNTIILNNKIGSAPGFYIYKYRKLFFLLPGVPNEMKEMFKQVKKILKNSIEEKEVIYSNILKLMDIREIEINDKIKDLFEKSQNPTIALLAKPGEVIIRLTAKGKKNCINNIIKPIKTEIKKRLGYFVWGENEDKIEELIAKELKKQHLTISGAESCTGGLIAKLLTDIPGASSYFMGSVNTYSNRSKEILLNVAKETLNNYGAVSKETALEMLNGVKKIFNTDIGYAITGIAGPTGGTKTKPIGTVFIGYFIYDKIIVKKKLFIGNRDDIRRQAAHYLLFYLLKELKK